jgi:hypothetical protein
MKVVKDRGKVLSLEQPQRLVEPDSFEAVAGTRSTQQLLDDLLGRLEDDDSLAFLPQSVSS